MSEHFENRVENRRPLSSRNNKWLAGFAAWLAHKRFPTPNQISCLSMLFALFGAAALFFSQSISALIFCALMVQIRLLCNLFDGMVAVEGGKKTANGAIFNEFPDRVADSLFLIALGYATPFFWLGWLAALLAALTAYIRIFGGSLGLPQRFQGPMAKQQRMAAITVGCLLAAVEIYFNLTAYTLSATLIIITLGTAYTCYVRTMAISAELNSLEQQNEKVTR
ncbi:CDP-alcohol phosphatidyltransferase family protein [Mannheimia pernigra]|uniref:CDP-alcohol phosphatidyltransferase family protein n=1 Tax=Mannheimia pernigra TaxID=111844 RepID=UPI00159F51C8|nr:CDP-alcohol phosphatidyltransferase family protein [Mannheimia pernigra]QLB45302.1 CDP-alcohol phosphatidyltransferase family protein [Mannheimia pernigra]